MVHVLTPEGKKQLEEKLNYYKTVRRVEVSKKIGIAREFGDLSENSEYDAAKEEQAQIEAEIREMEDILLTCQIINKQEGSSDVVQIGSQVKLYDEEFDEELEYKILGSTESDPAHGIISNISPVGFALLGKKKGDVIKVRTDGSEITYKILGIK
mgnify:FL=1